MSSRPSRFASRVWYHETAQRLHRPLEHFVALHPGAGRALGRMVVPVLHAAFHVEEALALSVGVKVGRHHPRLRGALEHDGSRARRRTGCRCRGRSSREGANARPHRPRARVVPLRADELLGDPERVDESGAHRLHVERGASLGPEAGLQPACGRRVDPIRRGGSRPRSGRDRRPRGRPPRGLDATRAPRGRRSSPRGRRCAVRGSPCAPGSTRPWYRRSWQAPRW